MGPKGPSINKETKQEIASRELEKFAYDVYDYLFNTYKFIDSDHENKFMKHVSKRLSSEGKVVVKHFNDTIGKAVQVSEFLLREHFSKLLVFTYRDDDIFKREVKLMWKHWLENRTNIFVKVIDTLAIITIILQHCEGLKQFSFERNDAAGWFMEWFKEDLELQFFKSGGWKQLEKISLDWYADLVLYVDDHPEIHGAKARHEYCDINYNCNLIKHLETSPVFFPVPKEKICDSCRARLNKEGNPCINPVYVRVEREFMKSDHFKQIFDIHKKTLEYLSHLNEFYPEELKSKASELPERIRKQDSSGKSKIVETSGQLSIIGSSPSPTDTVKDTSKGAISKTLTPQKQKRSLPSTSSRTEPELHIKDSSSTAQSSEKTALPAFLTELSTNPEECTRGIGFISLTERAQRDERTGETQEYEPLQIKPDLMTSDSKKSPVLESSPEIILRPSEPEHKQPIEDSALTEQVSVEPSSAEEIPKPDVEHTQTVKDSTQTEKVSKTLEQDLGFSREDSLLEIPRLEEASAQLPECTPYGNFLKAVQESGPIHEEKFHLLSEKYSYSFNNMCNERGEPFYFKVFPYDFYPDGKPKRERIPNTLTLIKHESPCYIIGGKNKTRKTSTGRTEVKTSEGRKKSGSQKRKTSKSKTETDTKNKLESEKKPGEDGKSEGEKKEVGASEVEKSSEEVGASEVEKSPEEVGAFEVEKSSEEVGAFEAEVKKSSEEVGASEVEKSEKGISADVKKPEEEHLQTVKGGSH